MKIRFLFGLLVTVFLSVTLAACGQNPTPTPAATIEAPPAVVSASGKLTPARWASLSFQAGGHVVAVKVQVGDPVKAGDVLVQLDDTDARLAVAQAEAALNVARAQRDVLAAGARPEEIEAARTAISITQATLAGAQADLSQLYAGADAADVRAAEAALAQAQASRLAAWQAHEQTMKCYDVRLPNGKEDEICPALGTLEEQARANLAAADQAVAAAQARLDRLHKGATRGELGAARSRVAAAAAQVAQAQAQLDLLKAGASREQLAAAEASVQQAQVAVDVAKAQLSKLQLTAPFDGVIGAVLARQGEQARPGEVVVMLGDAAALRVETTDLSEVDIARVREGQPVKVTFDALPGVTIPGRVARIAPMSTPGQSGVNYMVIVELDKLDPALRWGMTAFVDVLVD